MKFRMQLKFMKKLYQFIAIYSQLINNYTIILNKVVINLKLN